jgi:hypothetical protein
MALKVKKRIAKSDEHAGRPSIPVLSKEDIEEQLRIPRVKERLARVRRRMQQS